MKTVVLVVDMFWCSVVFVFCTLAILTSKDLPVLPSWWFSKHFDFHLIKYQYEATAKDPIVAYADLYGMYISGLNGTTEREYDERHHPWMDVLSLSFFGNHSSSDVVQDSHLNRCASKMLLVGAAIWTILLKGCGARFVSFVFQQLQRHDETHEEDADTSISKAIALVLLKIMFVSINIKAISDLSDECALKEGANLLLDSVAYSSLDSKAGLIFILLIVAACLDLAYILYCIYKIVIKVRNKNENGTSVEMARQHYRFSKLVKL